LLGNVKQVLGGTGLRADVFCRSAEYGCPFYEKDALHPPFAPNAEETRKVLNEFDKALLLTGPDGPKLSQQAIKIEHEAYTRGYYKAFSLLSLPFNVTYILLQQLFSIAEGIHSEIPAFLQSPEGRSVLKWVEKAADKNAQVLFISSTHLGEPIAWGGPIVMNTKDE